MKSPQILKENLFVEKFIPGGQALATFTEKTTKDGSINPSYGKKVFLWNALPGETITESIITKKKSSYLEGIATKIENPSPYRIEPKDSCFLSTSPWQILSWDYELKQKQLLVEESLRQEHIVLQDSVSVDAVKTDGKEWHYRNKMEYSLYWDNDDQKIYLAFHNRSSHTKIPLKPSGSLQDGQKTQNAYSSIERPEIAEKALKIVQELNSAHASARSYQSLLLRSNQQGVVSGGLFENYKPHPSFDNLTDVILGQEYSYSPNGFFQINLPVYELALKAIKQEVDSEPSLDVLDLYAGVGTIGLSVAKDRSLTLVEVNKDAYAELDKNCLSININNSTSEEITKPSSDSTPSNTSHHDTATPAIRPILAKSEDVLDYIKPSQIIILDPPRSGCDKKLINRLLEIKPKLIIYLSCNPTTQARDVKLLLEGNTYHITKITPFNFFPKTPHIENLIILKS